MPSPHEQTLSALKKKLRQATPAVARPQGLACRRAVLDRHLPDGWPRGELTEILYPYSGIGELNLLAPALSTLSQAHWLAWVHPPAQPQAAALRQLGYRLERLLVVRTATTADALWATEQVLRSGVCAAVVCWLQAVSDRQLRRLQLAAEQGRCAGFLLRPDSFGQQRSPAALRLTLQAGDSRRLHGTIIKHRGHRPSPSFELSRRQPAPW